MSRLTDPPEFRSRALRDGWLSTLAVAVVLLAAHSARAECQCSTSTRAPYCTGIGVSETSYQGTTNGIAFGSRGGSKTYVCGQYANGDVWVVGKGAPRAVAVESTRPAWDGEKHGHMVNPSWDSQTFDARNPDNKMRRSGPPVSVPAVFETDEGPVSFVKATSKKAYKANTFRMCEGPDGSPDANRSCLKFVSVFTFVDEIPDSDDDGSTADEFRPAWIGQGKDKPGPYNTAMMDPRLSAWPSLDGNFVQTKNSLENTAKNTRFITLWFQNNNFSDFHNPQDNNRYGAFRGCQYNADHALCSVSNALRLMLNDVRVQQEEPRSAGRQALINYVQRGIDKWGALRDGKRFYMGFGSSNGWGGHWTGHKTDVTVASYLLGDVEFQSFISENKHFAEDRMVYRAADGVPYLGVGDGDCTRAPADLCSNTKFSAFCRPGDPRNGYDVTCCGHRAYARVWQNLGVYQTLVVELLGVQSIWNHDDFLIWGRSIKQGGRGPGHDRLAYCGTSNVGGSTNTKEDPGRKSKIGEQMWAGFEKDAWREYTPPPQGTIPTLPPDENVPDSSPSELEPPELHD